MPTTAIHHCRGNGFVEKILVNLSINHKLKTQQIGGNGA